MKAPDVPKRIPTSASNAKEFFSGTIGFNKASQLEERFARELVRRSIEFTFQVRVSPMFGLSTHKSNTPGEVEIDFLAVWRGLLQPIQIDGEIAHYKMAWQKDKDKNKDDIVNSALKSFGAQPVLRIPYWQIWTPEQTRLKVMEIFV